MFGDLTTGYSLGSSIFTRESCVSRSGISSAGETKSATKALLCGVRLPRGLAEATWLTFSLEAHHAGS